MDHTPFKIPFTKDRVPYWQCPTCGGGQLKLLPNSLAKQETQQSRLAHEHEAWEPEWIEYVYSCIFICTNSVCKEVISSCGTGRVDYNEYEDERDGWVQVTEDLFTPRFFQPPLRLIDIPLDCPFDVSSYLRESFSLFFSDPNAALNSARTAIEAVLTQLGVKKFANVKGSRRPINLHQRITLLPKKHAHLVELLTAIKWLGNAGSHAGSSVSADDVLVAYNLIEHVLADIYNNPKSDLVAVAKKVNKRKGPIKPPSRKRSVVKKK